MRDAYGRGALCAGMAWLWIAAACMAGVHRADFSLGGSGGFSRAGWDEDLDRRQKQSDGRTGIGIWGWMFTCRNGQVIVTRVGRGKGLGAEDLGAGLGGPWPRPLVDGGLFVNAPRPGFGPYQLPLTFDVQAADIKGFLAAGTPADGRPKFLGVVAEIEAERGVRLVCAGLRGTKKLRCGIYELPGYKVLAESAPPKLAGAAKIRVVCTADKLTVWFGAASLDTPLKNARNVRAVAFRVAGTVGPAGPVDRAAVISAMSLSAPNVPDFPVKDNPRPKPGGSLLRREGTKLLLDKRPFRAVGMNHVRLLYHFAGLDTNPAFGEHILRSLAREGFTVLRVAATEHVPHFNKRGKVYTMFRLFERNPDAYFAGFDRMLGAAQRAGVRLIPVLIWGSSNIADHLGTSAYGKANFPAIRRTYLDPSSREHNFLKRYLTALATRYRDHDTILCWEIGNEWQNSVPKTDYYYRFNPRKEKPNPYVPRWRQRFEHLDALDAWQQLRKVQASCGRILKSADPNHLVLSAPESVSVHFAPDNNTYRTVMGKMIPPEIDLMGYHQYANSVGRQPMKPWGYSPFLTKARMTPWDAHVEVIREVAATVHGGRPVVLGECNVHYDRRPAMRATRLGNLRDLFAAAANVSPHPGGMKRNGPPRVPIVLGWEWVPRPDTVDGYSLYPKSCRGLYGRSDLDAFVEQRVDLFRQLRAWYNR